jgi:hypothetical protein
MLENFLKLGICIINSLFIIVLKWGAEVLHTWRGVASCDIQQILDSCHCYLMVALFDVLLTVYHYVSL